VYINNFGLLEIFKNDAPQKEKNVVQVHEGAEIRRKRGDKER
jgi:hypothetical protein